MEDLPVVPLDRDSLVAAGFIGWVPFDELPTAAVPSVAGVYVVIRTAEGPPEFLAESPAGLHKGRRPSVSTERLKSKWVDGAVVLYIGKAVNLADRLDSYRRHGIGHAAGHWGGRFLWQCDDAATALVAWKQSTVDPEDDESEMLTAFVTAHGRLPFANLKRGRRRPS